MLRWTIFRSCNPAPWIIKIIFFCGNQANTRHSLRKRLFILFNERGRNFANWWWLYDWYRKQYFMHLIVKLMNWVIIIATGNIDPSTEVDQWFREKRVKVSPFVFWSSKREDYPRLFQISSQFLCVPATSAPVERLFSHRGLVTRPHRACLSPSLLEQIVFLKCNRPSTTWIHCC